MTRAFIVAQYAQYAKDARKHDSSRILFDRHTGNPTGWTDTAGKAHALPVDFTRVSAATCEQYRAWSLQQAGAVQSVPADEQTMDHVAVREFDQSLKSVQSEFARAFCRALNAKEDRRDFWIQAALLALAAVIGAAVYAATMAIVGAVVGR